MFIDGVISRHVSKRVNFVFAGIPVCAGAANYSSKRRLKSPNHLPPSLSLAYQHPGNVRAESFTRPVQLFPIGGGGGGELNGAQESRQQDLYGPDCTPDPAAAGVGGGGGGGLDAIGEASSVGDESSSLYGRSSVVVFGRGGGSVELSDVGASAGGPGSSVASSGAGSDANELLHKFANSQYYR